MKKCCKNCGNEVYEMNCCPIDAGIQMRLDKDFFCCSFFKEKDKYVCKVLLKSGRVIEGTREWLDDYMSVNEEGRKIEKEIEVYRVKNENISL